MKTISTWEFSSQRHTALSQTPARVFGAGKQHLRSLTMTIILSCHHTLDNNYWKISNILRNPLLD